MTAHLAGLAGAAESGDFRAIGRAIRGAGAEIVTAAKALHAQDSGKVMFLSAAAGFATTLPPPALGLEFTFIVKTAPTSNGYTIVTNGSANIMVVSVNEVETDTTEDGPTDDNADIITLVANVALAGDMLRFWCDGTLWYAIGQTRADGGITTGTT